MTYATASYAAAIVSVGVDICRSIADIRDDRFWFPVLPTTPQDLLADGILCGSHGPQDAIVHVADQVAEVHPIVDNFVLHVPEQDANCPLILDVQPQPRRNTVCVALEVGRGGVDEILCGLGAGPCVCLGVVEARERSLAVGADRVVVECVCLANLLDPAAQATCDGVNS